MSVDRDVADLYLHAAVRMISFIRAEYANVYIWWRHISSARVNLQYYYFYYFVWSTDDDLWFSSVNFTKLALCFTSNYLVRAF